MELDGAFGDRQRGGDVAIRQAGRPPAAAPSARAASAVREPARCASACSSTSLALSARRQVRVRRHAPCGSRRPARSPAAPFSTIPSAPGANRAEDVLVEVVGREHDDPRTPGRAASSVAIDDSPSAPCSRMSSSTTSGFGSAQRRDRRLDAFRRTSHQPDVRRAIECRAHAVVHDRMIVDDRARGSCGVALRRADA